MIKSIHRRASCVPLVITVDQISFDIGSIPTHPSTPSPHPLPHQSNKMKTKINISSSTTDGPAIPGYLYTPPDGTTVQGCVLCLPGSGGGVGPGIAVHPQLFADVDKRGCHGGLYMRLGQELSTGHTVDWQSRRKPTRPQPTPNPGSNHQTLPLANPNPNVVARQFFKLIGPSSPENGYGAWT